MAMRTTAVDVKRILDNTTLTNTIIEAYISASNVMVTQILGTTLSDTVLTEIEKWLAGHLIASTRERQAKKEGAGGAEIEYTGKYGLGFTLTSYGQMVLALDTTGAMALAQGNVDNSKKSAWVRAVNNFDT